MRRSPDRGVDVAIVDGVRRIGPNFVLRRLVLRSDVLREDPVVVHVIMSEALLFSDANRRQPLDHAAADVAWHEQADWVAVVGVEQLAVLQEGKHAWARG